MSRRERRAGWGYNKEMEDMRAQMEAEKKEMEEKLRTAAKLMVLKERESWNTDRQTMQWKLSVASGENRKLKAALQKAKDETRRREEEFGSLHRDLSALEEKYDASMVAWWKKLNEERETAEREMIKRDEQIVSLQQSLHAQREETERARASVDERKEAGGVTSVEEWQRKVRQLEELLAEKDQLVVRANNKRRARTNAHVDTLAQLNEAQSALKQSKLMCDALQEKLAEREKSFQRELTEREESFRKELSQREERWNNQLSEKESFQRELTERVESFRKELSQREERWKNQLSQKQSFQKELSDRVSRSRKELSNLCESWERRAQQWGKEKQELEEMLLVKEKLWKYKEAERTEEIRRLTEELTVGKKQKKNVCSWST